MSVTWTDIQRLAADFQRIQLAECSKKLSENNCVEVVSILIDLKIIDIVFTVDGREYVTRKHLLTEIKDECTSRGGRVSLSDLAHVLNISYEHIESAVATILKQSSSFTLCNAELISKHYVTVLCNEINERLTDVGIISISQLAKTWDLPTELLNNSVLAEVGSKIDAVRDGDVLYTRSYWLAQRNVIRAVLCGLTKATPVAKVQAVLELTNMTFWSLFDELDAANEVPGKVVGGRISSHCVYYPDIYTALVRQYIIKTFSQDGILELAVLIKLSVTEPKSYLREVLKETEHSEVIFFPHAVISNKVWDDIEAAVKEQVEIKLSVDVREHLPDIIQGDADVEQVITSLIKINKEWLTVSGTSYIYSQRLLSNALKALNDFINDRVEEFVYVSKKQKKVSKKEDKKHWDDWSATKTKKGKSGKGKGSKQVTSEESAIEIPGKLSENDLISELEKTSSIPKELLKDVVGHIQSDAETLLMSRIESLLHTLQTISAQDQKRNHAQLQENLSTLYDSICIFGNGADAFEDAIANNLIIHLFRTLCTQFANSVLSYVSRRKDVDTLSTKIRDEVIANIENMESRLAIEKLYMTLSTKDLRAFHDAVWNVCSSAVCALNLKMPDKKQRAELIKAYEEGLVTQLRECAEPASGLLLALLILLARNQKIAVHASGKFVPHLIAKVENQPETISGLFDLLRRSQKLVIANMQSKGDENLRGKLDEILVTLKATVIGNEYLGNSTIDED